MLPLAGPDWGCEPKRPLFVPAAAAATGVDAKRINRLIDDRLLPSSAHTTVDNRRAIYAFALAMVLFGAGDGAKLGKRARLAVMREIEGLMKKHWDSFSSLDAEREPLRYEDGTLHVDLEGAITTAVEGLAKLIKAESKVVEDPDMRGGIPTIKGTRIGVYEAADLAEVEDIDAALDCYPSLSREDVELAIIYAKAHPLPSRPKRRSYGLIVTSNRRPPVRYSFEALRAMEKADDEIPH